MLLEQGADYLSQQKHVYTTSTADDQIPADADVVVVGDTISIQLPSTGVRLGKQITVCAGNGNATVVAPSPGVIPLAGGGTVLGSGSRTYTLMAIALDDPTELIWAAQVVA